MTLYAVHHAWIDDHAVKAPVGIWGEGGVSFYPVETESYREKGSQAETEAAQMLWRHWVEKRTERGSTYGASWSAVESDVPMDQVLTDLRAKFLVEPHPIKKIFLPDAEEDFETPKEDSEALKEDSEDLGPGEPAQRFLFAQSWWIASEIVRRHPELALRGEDHLSYLTIIERNTGVTRAVVNPATVHIPGQDTYESRWGAPRAIATDKPRDFLRDIEAAANLGSPTQAPPSTTQALVYRFVSAVLTAQVNDKYLWDCRNEIADADHDLLFRGWIDRFPHTRESVSSARLQGWEQGVPERHYWALTRDEEPIALVSVEGILYRHDRVIDLIAEFERSGRKLLPLSVGTLGDVLQ